jgi:hypothetical protein
MGCFMHDVPIPGSPVRQILENHMRKGVLLLALVFAVSAPTLASAAKKKAAPADPTVAAQKNSASFMQDALHQIIVPLESLSAPPKAAKSKSKRAKKKSGY